MDIGCVGHMSLLKSYTKERHEWMLDYKLSSGGLSRAYMRVLHLGLALIPGGGLQCIQSECHGLLRVCQS